QFQYTPETKVEMIIAVSDKARIHEDSVAFYSHIGHDRRCLSGYHAGLRGQKRGKRGGYKM
ncbi:MAG: hypothetical protein ABII25_03905, partial [bacterium]